MVSARKWRSRRIRHCSRYCARIWDSREQNTAASWVSAARAPCCWMERRSCRAWCWVSRAPATLCEPSKRWRRAASCIPCRRRSPTWAPRNAVTARPPFSSPLKPYSPTIPSRHAPRSKTRWPATSAAAPATSRFTRRSSWRRPGCAGRRLNPRVNRSMGDRSAHRIIGKALRKVDAVAKVTGATKFADDLAFPRMLYCRLLRSTQPHARIVSIDVIKVVYEPLKSFDSAEAAVAHPEPQIHDYADSGNLHKLINLEFGDVEAAIGEADLVQEDLFFFEGNTHLPMEQHAAVASWSPDGKLTLWTSTQTPHYVHRALAKVLELPA